MLREEVGSRVWVQWECGGELSITKSEDGTFGLNLIVVTNLPANEGDVRDAHSIPGLGDPLEEAMATHSSVLAWRIPWTAAYQATLSMGCKELDTTE